MSGLFYSLAVLIFFSIYGNAQTIESYTPIHKCIEINGSNFTAIRSFDSGKQVRYLIVNDNTLSTSIVKDINNSIVSCQDHNDSRYSQLVTNTSSPPYPLQDDGMINTGYGMTITADFCPSSKDGFENEIFEHMIEALPNPVPVTLFLSGKWIVKHQKSFEQLKQWNNEKKLNITWGNHTYKHPYSRKIPLEKNFSLTKGYDLRSDTLALEKLLLQRGVVPSIFFRFPGLVSDKNSIDTIKNLGLITIGSDTWIAKKQKLKKGSIILIHGNKNEHIGVKMFRDLIDKGQIQDIHSIDEISRPSTDK